MSYGTVQHHSISISSTQFSGQSRLGRAQVARRFGIIRAQFQLQRRLLSYLYVQVDCVLKPRYKKCTEKRKDKDDRVKKNIQEELNLKTYKVLT